MQMWIRCAAAGATVRARLATRTGDYDSDLGEYADHAQPQIDELPAPADDAVDLDAGSDVSDNEGQLGEAGAMYQQPVPPPPPLLPPAAPVVHHPNVELHDGNNRCDGNNRSWCRLGSGSGRSAAHQRPVNAAANQRHHDRHKQGSIKTSEVKEENAIEKQREELLKERKKKREADAREAEETAKQQDNRPSPRQPPPLPPPPPSAGQAKAS